MITDETKALLAEAEKVFGEETQFVVAMEECSELIGSLCKLLRSRIDESNIRAEIADVLIMASQLQVMFGYEEVEQIKEQKLIRLKERIDAFTTLRAAVR